MDNKRITSHQLYTLTATISLGGSILISSATVAAVAKQDSWLSALMAVGYGVPIMLLLYFLGSKYPGMTLLGMINKILGKWLGLIVSCGYVFLFLMVSAHVPWYTGNYFGRIMHETPTYYLNLFFIAGVVIAVFYGVETFARASELIVLFVTVFFILFNVMLIKDIHIEYLAPVLENGILPPLKGSIFLSTYITFAVINVLMIFPRHIRDIPQAKKAIIKGFLWSGSISFITILMSTLILGSVLPAKLSFSTLILAGELNIETYISRVEYIVTIIWLYTQFMIGVSFFYSGITGLSELLGLKNHKMIILPFGLLALVLSEIVFPNTLYQNNWVNMVYTPFIATFGFVIPLILMIVHIIRKSILKIISG